MKPYHQYWPFSAMRGAMTLLASIAIVTIPQAASFMLSIPVLLAFAIDCLATYSFFDGGVMVLLAKLLPARATHLKALYAQAAMAASTGVLLYLVVYGTLGFRWVMWIAASQAAFAAVVELLVAKDTHRQYGCASCYATAIVLGVSALCLPLAGALSPTGISLALSIYVGAYGTSELLLGARMLFMEYRAEHPAKEMSSAWRLEMSKPVVVELRSASVRSSVPERALPSALPTAA